MPALCVTLAVELLQFEGIHQGKNNNLNWLTSSEHQTETFILEHSTDGIYFTVLAHVNAMGNDFGGVGYDFVHQNVATGIHYYRLLEQDVDGGISLLSSLGIEVRSSKQNPSIVLYPNPSSGMVSVVSKGETSIQNIRITDITGKLIMEEKIVGAEKTTHEIDISDFNNGLYLIIVTGEHNSFSSRLIKR